MTPLGGGPNVLDMTTALPYDQLVVDLLEAADEARARTTT